jgi:hypothetical protein
MSTDTAIRPTFHHVNAASGESFADIHRRAMAGELSPAQPPVETPTED